MHPDTINTRMAAARHYFELGNIPQAELICRGAIDLFGDNPDAYTMLGMIALYIDLPDFASTYFQKVINLDPSNPIAKEKLLLAQKLVSDKKDSSASHETSHGGRTDRFLLIKAWGYGFWSDMDHVLGQLLLAELTGRIPIVHWGENSLFRDKGCDNAFDLYFEPVSQYDIHHIISGHLDCYPPKWSQANLASNDINKWEGNFSRMSGLYSLGRLEDVVVSDFHTYVNDVIPWIPEDHPLHGMFPQEIYRYLFGKYIKLKPDISVKIEDFWNRCLCENKILAVHVRGSDKQIENIENKWLEDVNKSYFLEIDRIMSQRNDERIFLLTDSQSILNIYKNRYKEKLLYTSCTRTESNTGIHYLEHTNRRGIGIDVIRDVYLASRCANFIGNGSSNVSTTILHLKDWKPEQYVLLDENRLFRRNYFLHIS